MSDLLDHTGAARAVPDADGREKIGPGALVLVVGPSGAGKDTLIALARETLANDDGIVFPRRVVTRPPDATEDNEAIAPEAFADFVAGGEAALWWEAHGLGYAVPASIDGEIRAGAVVVVNVSRRIVPEALARYARVTVVFVTAPREVLAARLAGRGRETIESVNARLDRAGDALPAAPSLIVIQNVGAPEIGAERLVDALRDLAAATRR